MINRLIIFCVAILPFLASTESSVPTAIGLLFLYIIGGLYLIKAAPGTGGNGIYLLNQRLIITIAILLLYGNLVAWTNSLDLETSIAFSLRISTILIIYLLGTKIARQRHELINISIWTVTLCCATFAASGLMSWLYDLGVSIGGVERSRGLATSVNNLALYSAIGIFCSLHLYRDRRKRDAGGRGTALIVLLICAAGLITAGSLGVIAAVTASLIISTLRQQRRKLANLGAIASVLIVLAIWDLTTGGGVAFRVSQLIESHSFNSDLNNPENSLQWRLLHWSLLLSRWREEYFWFGAGIGQDIALSTLRTLDDAGYSAHNEFIAFVIEFGLAGTILASLMLARVWRQNNARLYVRSHANLFRHTMLIFVLISALVAPVFATGAIQYYTPLLLGVLSGQRALEAASLRRAAYALYH